LTGQFDGLASVRLSVSMKGPFALPVGVTKIAQSSTAAAIAPQRRASNL
jgi:hypothetical protein